MKFGTEYLSKMDIQKSKRPDEILLTVLRELADAIVRPLTVTLGRWC